MRLSGLASGFDTDTMVKQLMQIERMKVDRVEQNKQTILWRQEQYNSVNKDLANFILNTQKDIGLKKTSSTGSLFGTSYKNLDYVKKAVSSDETVATINSTGKTTNGSFEIEVLQTPRNASFTSAEINFDFKDKDGNPIKHMEFKINDTMITVGEEGGTKDINMDDVIRAINSATKKEGTKDVSLGVTAFFDEGTKRMFLESSQGGKEINITGTPKGHGFVYAINGGETLGPIKEAGKPDVMPELSKTQSLSIAGNEGKAKVNGVDVTLKDGKVNFNGLSIEIKAEGTTRINVSTNTEGIMEKIEKLVADYNELVDKVSSLTGEKRYASYKPLSQEERKAMSEEDLKLWDEKAKSGLLNRDETLERTLQTVRNDLYKTLEGASGSFNHITQVGISTEQYAKGSAGGKLQINTEKLRKAIEEDADSVMELLFKEGNIKDGKEIFDPTSGINNPSTKGIFTRVYDDLIDGMKSIIDKSGPGNDGDLYRGIRSNMLIDFVTKKGSISDLDKSVLDMNRQIDNLNILLAKKEDAHYAKFTAMEKNMYQMQNQSSWLAQQFQF